MGIITLIVSLLLGLLTLAPASSTQSSAAMVETGVPIAAAPVESTPEVLVAAPAAGPTISEIYTLLDAGRGIFLPSEWRASAVEKDDRTTLTYTSTRDSAVVHLEYLHFPDMSSDFSVPDYVTHAYFEVVLSSYEPWSEISKCSQDGLYLYEFDGKFKGSTYDIRYWAQTAAPDRVQTVFMTFERGTEALDGYAQAMFPTLSSCPS